MDSATAAGDPSGDAGRRFQSPQQSFWESAPVLQADLEQVQAVIDGIARDATLSIRDALERTVGNTGKMLRPALVLLSARSGRLRPAGRWRARPRDALSFSGQPPEKMYRIAGAVEVLHMATLVHDDVIDGAATRRGAAALHTEQGNRRAILMGDLLFSSCFSLLAEDATMDNAQVLAAGVRHICESQIDESLPASVGPRTPREYFRQVAAKTALLFMLSCHIGASENDVIIRDAQALRRFGYNLGMAFQVVDDLLDLTGTPEELGKPVGTDLRSGVPSLPIIYALQRDDGALSEALQGEIAERDIPRLVSLISDRGGLARARETAERYTERARRELDTLPPSQARETLSWLVDVSLNRRR